MTVDIRLSSPNHRIRSLLSAFKSPLQPSFWKSSILHPYLLKRPSPNPDAFGETGIIELPSYFSDQLCTDAIRSFYEFKSSANCNLESPHSFQNSRLYNLHVASASLNSLCTDSSVLSLIDDLLCSKSMLYTSIYFEYSSQQSSHVDFPYFITSHPWNFVGYWISLESVGLNNGPLFYYKGSHRLLSDPDLIAKIFGLSSSIPEFNSRLQSIVSATCPLVVCEAKPGSVFIWHPCLMHGGMPRTHVNSTRHSIVSHLTTIDDHVSHTGFSGSSSASTVRLRSYGASPSRRQFTVPGPIWHFE